MESCYARRLHRPSPPRMKWTRRFVASSRLSAVERIGQRRCTVIFSGATGDNRGNRDFDSLVRFLCLLLLSAAFPSSLVCSWKNQPANAVSDFHLVEIDQQTERHVQQFHVAQELRLVNRQNLFHRLRLHQYATLNQHIKPEGFLSRKSLILDQKRFLTDAR